MTPVGAASALAARATPARLALALAAVLAAYLAVTFVHWPIDEALRHGACSGLDCLKPLRPDTRHSGYRATDFREYLVAIGPLRSRALAGLLVDLPLIAAVTTALVLAAGLASRGLTLNERSARLILVMPLAYAACDLAENLLLALAYTGLADVAAILPWVSALKFGTAVASGAVSCVIGVMRAAV